MVRQQEKCSDAVEHKCHVSRVVMHFFYSQVAVTCQGTALTDTTELKRVERLQHMMMRILQPGEFLESLAVGP